MAKSNLIKDIANEKVSLQVSLKRSLVIADSLDNQKMVDWLKHELYGYPVGTHLPDYRLFKGVPLVSYLSGRELITNEQIPESQIDEQYKDILVFHCADGIGTIEKFLDPNVDAKHSLVGCIPAINNENPLIQIVGFCLRLPIQGFLNVRSAVEEELLTLLLKLDKEVGNLDDLDVSVDEEEKKKINQYINIHIDSMVSIGDNNMIKDSVIGKNTVEKKK